MLLSVSNLSKRYGDFLAVDNISFSIKEGEIFGFLGLNGAGKTTTLRMLAGILEPSDGEIVIGGHNLATSPIEAKRITGYIPDRPYLYPKLTGQEFLQFIGDLYELPKKDIPSKIEYLLKEYSLTEWAHELVESYSHGMRQRLATCAALLHEPKFLIVDEPMVGLDPQGARFLKNSFKRYAKEGMGILLSTHSLNVAEEITDRLAIVHKGKILIQGTLSEIKEQSGKEGLNLEDLFLELTSHESHSS